MRIILTVFLTLFLASLLIRNTHGAYKGMNLWNLLLHFTPLSGNQAANQKTDDFLRQLKDKKEDLEHVQDQINSLRIGLKEMPDTNQNGYFKDMLKQFQDKEYLLNQQLTQMDQQYQQMLRNLSPNDTFQRDRMIEENQQNHQEQKQRFRELMELNQMRTQAQAEMLSNLMEQHQMYLQALIDRTSALIEQNQKHSQSWSQQTK